jgi:hypothetical protein
MNYKLDAGAVLENIYHERVKEHIKQIKSVNMSKKEIEAEIKKINDEIDLSHKEQWERVKKQPKLTNFLILGGNRSQCQRLDALEFYLEHMK